MEFFFYEILDYFVFRESEEDFDLNSFKIILFALSNAKLPEKYRCMEMNMIQKIV